MRNVIERIKNKFSNREVDIYKAWDRELARASTPAHRAEINAIFSRHI